MPQIIREKLLAKFYYGGQAVIEGVMMRGQRHMAVAVRAPGGDIVVHQEPLDSAIYRHPVMKLPFLRGIVGLWDALGLGIKALMFAADVSMQDPEAQAPDPAGKQEGGFSGTVAWTSIAFALIVMVGIFFVLPVFAAGLIAKLLSSESSVIQNLIEGVIRLGLFLGYIFLIGRMRDIQRVFGYHGAEHKTINAYEAGVELTPERVQSFTLLNPRCGTTFLLIVLVLATVVFVAIGKLPFPMMVLSRILLVPVIAGISYEFIRLMANLYDHAIVRAIMAPGMALQKMTTRPPDLSMIEVGIVALKAVLVADGLLQAEQIPVPKGAGEAAEASAAIV